VVSRVRCWIEQPIHRLRDLAPEITQHDPHSLFLDPLRVVPFLRQSPRVPLHNHRQPLTIKANSARSGVMNSHYALVNTFRTLVCLPCFLRRMLQARQTSRPASGKKKAGSGTGLNGLNDR
jgi:hypothetical protein